MTHPESRISYFGNFRSHEIHCVSVCEVWTLVDLRTLMTHPEDDSSDVTYFYCVLMYVREGKGLGTS